MRKTLSIVLLIMLVLNIKSFSQDTSVKVSYTLKEGSNYYGYFSKGITLTGGWSATPNALAITYASRDFVIGGWKKTDGLWGGARFFINSDNGFIGIGTTKPKDKLHLKLGESGISPYENSGLTIENSKRVILQLLSPSNSDQYLLFGNSSKSNRAWISYNHNNDEMSFTHYNKAGNFLFTNGNVGIGKTPVNHKLDVNGTIRANEIIVSNPSTADFVFEDTYKLRSLREIEQFIKKNKHLPDVASAKQMKKNGVKQGEMNAKLLQKIEELTLYMIKQNKQTEKLLKETQLLKTENKELKNRIKKLEE